MRYGGHEGEYGGYGKLIANPTFTGAAGFADGTVAAPSICWTSDSDGSGTGLYRPGANMIGFAANGAEKFRIQPTEVSLFTEFRAGTGGAIGFGNGAGGTVTQATDKATGVSLSEQNGEITLNNAALAANTTVSFTLTNTGIAASDLVLVTHHSGGTMGAYTVGAQAASNSATIWVRNVTAGSLGEAIVLKFAVIRGSTT